MAARRGTLFVSGCTIIATVAVGLDEVDGALPEDLDAPPAAPAILEVSGGVPAVAAAFDGPGGASAVEAAVDDSPDVELSLVVASFAEPAYPLTPPARPASKALVSGVRSG